MATSRAAKTPKTPVSPEPAAGAKPPEKAARPDEAGRALKKRDLIERVTAETGLKRREVKAVTEAVLGVMGRAVSDGQSLNLDPWASSGWRVRRTTRATGC